MFSPATSFIEITVQDLAEVELMLSMALATGTDRPSPAIFPDLNHLGETFPLTRPGDFEGPCEPSDFVEGLLTEGGASIIYGPSNCGKSFWVLDLAAAIATGRQFREELEVERGAVIYVALEGIQGARNRIEALKLTGNLSNDDPLFLCFAPVSLLDPDHPFRLAETVKHAATLSNLPCRFVVLDTMARAMAGADENSGKDMTAAIAAIDAVRAATGAHVAAVHHCGKDETKGARGHSSLRAAVDTEIEVTRCEKENISTVRVTKQRDLPIGNAMPFSLKMVELGIDRRGKPITSCVVHHEDEMMAKKPGKPGPKPLCTAEDMLKYLPAESTTQWQKKVEDETGLKSTGFYKHKRYLEDAGKIQKDPKTKAITRAVEMSIRHQEKIAPQSPQSPQLKF